MTQLEVGKIETISDTPGGWLRVNLRLAGPATGFNRVYSEHTVNEDCQSLVWDVVDE